MIADGEHDVDYQTGYEHGESSVTADIIAAFDEVLGLDVDGPWDAAVKVKALLDAIERVSRERR